ncbi:MAG: hypothetical protein KGI92_06570 [Alphaproteobacteria bacterium]|nr:hypothetical protein [Alphaproteobacteria bacterium]
MADSSLPSPDERCGQHFRYRDLIEVGNTWERHRVDNRPRERATYDAMAALCAKVLDPVRAKFGDPQLTYAFASPALDKLVHQRPSPNTTRSRDQHAGCELNSKGKPYCSRLGLGVDFRCPGIGSVAVARWVIENTEFDRLYFYDDSRPFHVSVGPDNKRQATLMTKLPSGRLMPRRISIMYFKRILAATAAV